MLPDSKLKIQNSKFKIAVTGLCLLLLPSCGKQEKTVSEPVIPASVTFAVFGNTGLATDGGSAFRRLASSLDSIGVDFAAELGNKLPPVSRSTGCAELFDANNLMMREVNVPVYPVVGALDVFDYESDIVYSSLYGPMWYSFKRGGALFIVLSTSDDSYRTGFGVKASVGEDQLAWLNKTLNGVSAFSRKQTIVVFMNRPLWQDTPSLWREQLLPVFISGGVDLVMTCYSGGLFDWGMVDGIRAVSTGCISPSSPGMECGIGLFPHILLVTLDGENSSFRVLMPDGAVHEGIGVDATTYDKVRELVGALTPRILESGMSWNVGDIQEYRVSSPFDEQVRGSMDFTAYKSTNWEITPRSFSISLDRGETKTYSVGFSGREPDLAPVPTYRLVLKVGEITVADTGGSILRKIPDQRAGERIPIAAQVADAVPYLFDGKTLRVPVDISGLDKCGRLVMYRGDSPGLPVCVFISPLQDFRLGINEFTWNGRDLQNRPVSADSLDYYVFIYNKKAPPTLVAEGPPSLYGTLQILQTVGGLIAETHTDSTLVRYRIAGSIDRPEAEIVSSLRVILDGLSAVGIAYERDDRLFVTTEKGLVCTLLHEGKVSPDRSFGDNGYLIFEDYRGRRIGNPVLSRGIVYVGIGGGNGESPVIVSVDSKSGEITNSLSLEDYFKGKDEPPALEATGQGLYISHPEGEYVLHMRGNGDLLWINGPGDLGGDLDTDGRSFTYRIGVDQFGFSYVGTPGASARCCVLGPDGRALFRVILVILPGLRVNSAVPMIEGKSTDGLYFITRGADKPYVFHVPYTVKHGAIIDESRVMTR